MEKIWEFCLKVAKNRVFKYVLLLLFCLFLACLSKDYDYDLYARLIVGKSFVENGVINYEDFLSYTPTHLWYDHEWGASVFFYAFYKLFGAYGFILIQALLMFGTAFFVIKTQALQKHKYPTLLLFIATFLIVFNHLNPSLVRCHMFSFMLFSLFLYILEKTRVQNSNLIWSVPFIVIVWNNIHGGVVSGLGLVAMYFLGAMFSKKPCLKYAGVLALSVPLLAVNPYGTDYYNFLLSANTKARDFITEWWGVFALRHVYYYYSAFCVSMFAFLLMFAKILRGKNVNITKLIVLVVTLALGTAHVKLLSLSLIVVFSLFYGDIVKLFNRPVLRIFEKLTYVCVFCLVFCIPLMHPFIPRVEMKKFPVKEVEFLKINKLGGNIVSNFGIGSYVAYKLYPQNLIYMDGRYEEVYYDEEFNNLLHFERADEDWENILSEYSTEILLPEKALPVYKKLKTEKDWVEIYSGQYYAVFVRKNKVRKNYLLPTDNLKYYQKTAFDNMGMFGN